VSARSYAHVPSTRRPWAAVDVQSSAAARFCLRLLADALRYGLPASRSFGFARASVARSTLVSALPASVLARLPGRPRPDVDRVLIDLRSAWPRLADRAKLLPDVPPPLRALALHRSSALTVLAFANGSRPLLVAKRAGDGVRLEREAAALREAEGASLAPRYLGRAGAAYVQQALAGEALALEPLDPSSARVLTCAPVHTELSQALTRLARLTAKQGRPEQLREPIENAAAAVSGRAARMLDAAARDLRRLDISVLTHGDTSPQNVLAAGGRFAGLVDWENSRSHGAPGFDGWNFALAFLEHGVGLRRWSQERVLDTFRAALESPFYQVSREAGRAAALAAGVPDSLLEPLEIAFFARRVLVRRADPSRFPTSATTAARMLEAVCAR
jgi:Phosphotransferase enzyme family